MAVGTTVVRALEGSVASNGEVTAGAGTTDLRIDRAFRPRVVAGLLTGVHDRTTTHFELVHAFAPSPLLERAHVHAEAAGYLCHEFGDSALVLAA